MVMRRHRYSLWRQLKHSLLLELELELRRIGRRGKADRLPTSGGGDGDGGPERGLAEREVGAVHHLLRLAYRHGQATHLVHRPRLFVGAAVHVHVD